jgi:hypothetical protein
MNAVTWRVAGLIMALMGALTMANAGQGHNKSAKKGKPSHPSRAEIQKKYDVDGDGQLSEAERETLRADMKKHHSRQPKQSREEMRKKYDTDGDGQLSETERAALRADMQKRKGKRPCREQIMKKYDTDGDGKLSETERAVARKDFEARRAAGAKKKAKPQAKATCDK